MPPSPAWAAAPGNARTEELAIEAEGLRGRKANLVPLMSLIRKHFGPMKARYGWGTNPYYYLAGKYGIHPTYIQEMLGDARYDEEDILAVIDHLRAEGGKKFSFNTLDGARQFYRGAPRGSWSPAELMAGREVLILGTGPGGGAHRPALEAYIRRARPLVLALNTQSAIDPALIDLRIACHPVRLLADAEAMRTLPQPLITPASMLPEGACAPTSASGREGPIAPRLRPRHRARPFEFHETHCVAPTSLVLAYALAVATSGRAARILMAGFDGYPAGRCAQRRGPGGPGTDRIAEAAGMIDYDVYVNVQGDEPLVDPRDILRCIEEKQKHPGMIINGFCWITDAEDPTNVNLPKVITTEAGVMIYMSRSALPGFKNPENAPARYMKQVCIYGFNRQELEEYRAFGRKSLIEHSEDIEILRFLELGRQIRMYETRPGSLAVDVPEDIARVEAALRQQAQA
jgi:CMP-2-keto-3-deoxyoctulosonic acid synthetase